MASPPCGRLVGEDADGVASASRGRLVGGDADATESFVGEDADATEWYERGFRTLLKAEQKPVPSRLV